MKAGAAWRPIEAQHHDHTDPTLQDTNPHEVFVYHHAAAGAGLAGLGGSSYIDRVILRDRDANAGWSAEADGTLEERTYFLQNWRADVVGLVAASGAPIQQMRYEPYGVAFGVPRCDLDGDGDVDAADDTLFDALHAASNIRADWDFDGDFDAADTTAFVADHAADADLGRGAPSYEYARPGGAVRKLYAGYEHDPALAGETYHVRHRVLLAELGRWTRRDPLGYVDGWSLYAYTGTQPIIAVDPSGLALVEPGSPECPILVDTGAMSLSDDPDCRGGNWPDRPRTGIPNFEPPTVPPGKPGEQRIEMRCRKLFIVEHCWIRACWVLDDGTEYCENYSLMGWIGTDACIRRDWEGPECRGEGCGGDGIIDRQVSDPPDVADCARNAYLHQVAAGPCRYSYNPLDCNSNWFAGSIWQLCTGQRHCPTLAPGCEPNDCCRTKSDTFDGQHPFIVPPGYPGSTGEYGCLAWE